MKNSNTMFTKRFEKIKKRYTLLEHAWYIHNDAIHLVHF